MKKTIDELSLEVLDKIAERQLANFYLDNKSMMVPDELIRNIQTSINDYANTDVPKEKIIEKSDELYERVILNVAYKLTVLYVNNGITKALAIRGLAFDKPETV
jgi:hypothetical protein